MENSPVIFLNIGWMRLYEGPRADDPTRGNFGYLKGRKHGGECFNFAPKNGQCFGQKSGFGGIGISRLGAEKTDQFVDGVLLVWIARNPLTNKTCIVGWYKNARVYHQHQNPSMGKGYRGIPYITEAVEKNCHLLPVNQRVFHIPSRNEVDGGYGQSPVWYGLGKVFINKVKKYIKNPSVKRTKVSKKPGRTQNIELRQKIERVAIQHAINFYESDVGGGYQIESVEKEASGWDLEATRDGEVLRVEVKGRSVKNVCAELTPNEYSEMGKHRESYVVYIVTNCLDKKPASHVFRYMHDSEQWETEDGRVLDVEEKVAAVIGCK